jgi:hypothetical protein
LQRSHNSRYAEPAEQVAISAQTTGTASAIDWTGGTVRTL